MQLIYYSFDPFHTLAHSFIIVDYWGLGVLIYEMTAGVAPFYAETPMETYEMVISGRVQIPSHFSLQLGDLITKLLHTSQSKRLGRTVGGATSVMCHSWYSRFDWVRLLANVYF